MVEALAGGGRSRKYWNDLIAVRQDLTGAWQNRGARSRLEYAILTNEIMQWAFGLKVDKYKQVEDLGRENFKHLGAKTRKRDGEK